MPTKKVPERLQLPEKLREVRESTTVALKPIPLLKQSITGLDGKEHPFELRYYQVQGVYHMLVLPRMILGDDCGLGKTIETIAAMCYLWYKEPQNKVIVIAPKSAMEQWAAEIRRFTNGVRPIVAGENPRKGESPVEARKRSYLDWLNAPEDDKVVLILNYSLLVRDWNHDAFQPPMENGKPSKQPVIPGLLDGITRQASSIVSVFDEATAFKSDHTRAWEMARFLSERSKRAYGLTATLLKNHLFEGYCIYKAIRPGVFTTKDAFYKDYCYVEMKRVGKTKIPIIKGYKNLDKFREAIDPVFLGRKKHMVAKELPTLVTREISFPLNKGEEEKYQEALNGVIELGDGEVRDFEEHKALTSLMYCQMVVNSLSMLRFTEGAEIATGFAWESDSTKVGALSSKEQALVDLLSGELDGEKVIVYTRFASLVPRLQALLKREGVRSGAITGGVSGKQRKAFQDEFQDLNSDLPVIFITAAGSEAINLQVAKAMIFFDMPWSWGEYLQAIGRMIRIGSPNSGVLVFHLLAQRTSGDKKTIDHHVLRLLRTKKNIIDQVLGEGAVGALKFDKSGSSVKELVASLQRKTK